MSFKPSKHSKTLSGNLPTVWELPWQISPLLPQCSFTGAVWGFFKILSSWLMMIQIALSINVLIIYCATISTVNSNVCILECFVVPVITSDMTELWKWNKVKKLQDFFFLLVFLCCNKKVCCLSFWQCLHYYIANMQFQFHLNFMGSLISWDCCCLSHLSCLLLIYPSHTDLVISCWSDELSDNGGLAGQG